MSGDSDDWTCLKAKRERERDVMFNSLPEKYRNFPFFTFLFLTQESAASSKYSSFKYVFLLFLLFSHLEANWCVIVGLRFSGWTRAYFGVSIPQI
jgi:hypothetical protein